MLSRKKIHALRERLEMAQKPFFYYDNDADGLCSYLLFRRWLGRGEGIAVRSYPELDASYAKKALGGGADLVVILDKPVVSPSFFAALEGAHIPVVWIDHHEVQLKEMPVPAAVEVYNTAHEGGKAEPVTAIAYAVCRRREDVWIAVMGCIADHFLPSCVKTFARAYPEYWGKRIRKPFDAYYQTEIGTLARALNFGLKDSAGYVVQMQEYLARCTMPADVLAEVPDNTAFRAAYYALKKRYDALFAEAMREQGTDVLFFVYRGATSMSAELANELAYRLPVRVVAVVYVKEQITNVSLRGKGVRSLLARVLKSLGEGSGGGHEDAVGARIRSSDIERFQGLLFREVEAQGA